MIRKQKDGIQTGSVGTPYDDVYRTLQNDCKKWMIPIVNEAFGEHYTGNEQIIPAPNEHFLNRQDGVEVERITDSSFTIMGEEPKKYHIECQSRPDGSMLVRMFEYDSQIALDEAQIEEYCMTVKFPRTAVLFLRHNSKTPDEMTTVIRTKEGELTYKIPVIKLQNYTLQEIFDKKLLFFIPFYIFCFEKEFEKIEATENKMRLLQRDYINIRKHLDALCDQRMLTEYEKCIIIDMSKKVLNSIARGHSDIQKGIGDAMGGKILDCEAKVILRQGRSEGETKKLISLVCKKLAKGWSISEIAELLEEAESAITLICDAAAVYAPEYDVDSIYENWKARTLS